MKVHFSRIFSMYNRLNKGEVLFKKEETERFGRGKRTFERDIGEIRCLLAEHPESHKELLYDYKRKGYYFTKTDPNKLTTREIYIICKILLESRALIKEEMYPIIMKIIFHALPEEDHKQVKEMISNEMEHYVDLRHGKMLTSAIWDLTCAVKGQKRIQMQYKSLSRKTPHLKRVEPLGVMFSELYFYLIAYDTDLSGEERYEPRAFRIDRIESYQILNESFYVYYQDRFEEGEFRKRVHFMHPGKLKTWRFWCRERSLEAVLDRVYTAEIVQSEEDWYLIKAEEYGDGILMWLRAQGNGVRIVE